MQAEMPGLGPDNVWIFVALIAGAMVVACLRLIGHACYDAIRWHDLRVKVQQMRAEQKRRLDKLARIEAGVTGRPGRSKRSLPDNLREPVTMGDVVDAKLGEAEPAEATEAVELATAA